VAVGVLLDTFVVRSLLVPALTLEIGSAIWWPSKLRHVPDHPAAPEPHLPMPEPDSERVVPSAMGPST
jgi:RND superfamily putative drug exporter